MNPVAERQANTTRWYQAPMLWFALALTMTSVVAGIITIRIALLAESQTPAQPAQSLPGTQDHPRTTQEGAREDSSLDFHD